MEITQKQYRNIYVVFVSLFAINLVVNLWNTYEDHKLRNLKKADLQRKNGIEK